MHTRAKEEEGVRGEAGGGVRMKGWRARGGMGGKGGGGGESSSGAANSTHMVPHR